jgi:hypothetical protein
MLGRNICENMCNSNKSVQFVFIKKRSRLAGPLLTYIINTKLKLSFYLKTLYTLVIFQPLPVLATVT